MSIEKENDKICEMNQNYLCQFPSRVVSVRPGEVQLADLAAGLLRLRLRDPALRNCHSLHVHAAEAVEPGGRQAGLQRRPEVKMYGILDVQGLGSRAFPRLHE